MEISLLGFFTLLSHSARRNLIILDFVGALAVTLPFPLALSCCVFNLQHQRIDLG